MGIDNGITVTVKRERKREKGKKEKKKKKGENRKCASTSLCFFYSSRGWKYREIDRWSLR